MFESLSDRLSQSLKQITGKARLTDENIADALRDVRMALLDADVALPDADVALRCRTLTLRCAACNYGLRDGGGGGHGHGFLLRAEI